MNVCLTVVSTEIRKKDSSDVFIHYYLLIIPCFSEWVGEEPCPIKSSTTSSAFSKSKMGVGVAKDAGGRKRVEGKKLSAEGADSNKMKMELLVYCRIISE